MEPAHLIVSSTQSEGLIMAIHITHWLQEIGPPEETMGLALGALAICFSVILVHGSLQGELGLRQPINNNFRVVFN